MRVNKRKSELDWHKPNHSLVIGSISNEELYGLGIGFSYYEDGDLEFGFIIGRSFFNLEVLWGKAEELSYYEDEEREEYELEQFFQEWKEAIKNT